MVHPNHSISVVKNNFDPNKVFIMSYISSSVETRVKKITCFCKIVKLENIAKIPVITE